MGMSSSQARLLTLTARMHDIEYKAQRIEAQKLQMANESRRVYEQYLDALDAKKIQYKGINSDGSITFRDATLNSLVNGAIPNYDGECSYKPFLLKNGLTDEIYITQQFADYYGITAEGAPELGTLDDYLRANGMRETIDIMKTVKDYNNVISATPVSNIMSQEYIGATQGTPTRYIWTNDINPANITNINYSLTPINEPVVPINNTNINSPGSTNTNTGTGNGMTTPNHGTVSNGSQLSGGTTFVGPGASTGTLTPGGQTHPGISGGTIGNLDNNERYSQINDYFNDLSLSGGRVDYSRLQDIINQIKNEENGSGGDNNEGGDDTTPTEHVDYINFSNYSREDLIAIIFTNMDNFFAGYDIHPFGTFEEFMNPETNPNYAYFYGLSDLELASMAYNSNDIDIYFITQFINVNLGGGYESVPEGWDEETTIVFAEENQVLSKSFEYNGSAESVLNKLAYDLYEKQKDTNSEITPETIKTQLSSQFTDRQLVSLVTYYGTDTWNTILTNLMNNESVDEYSNRIAPDVELLYTGNVVNWTRIDGIPAQSEQKGTIDIPTAQQIATNVIVAFGKNGANITEENYNDLFNELVEKLSSTENADLAEINYLVCTYLTSTSNEPNSDITALYNYVFNGGSLPVMSHYDRERYNFVQKDKGECRVRYGKTQVPTGYKTWDVTDPEYKRLSEEYYLLKALENNNFKIIDEELANSTEFVSNWLTLNEGYLLEFDPITQEMIDTNVAVNTNLQEVSDEKDLKKAEAKYEADMKRIDMKDRRYDTQLAALDNERNAVKQEMETVKTVAKDNVDRTFRLFS